MGRYVVEDEGRYQVEGDSPGVLQRAGNWIADTFGPSGNLRGSSIGGVMQGMANPVVGAVQLGAHALGLGDKVDPAIAAKEQEYQQARKAAGREGFDAAQLVGEVASPVNLGLGALGRVASGASMGSKIAAGAGSGAVGGLLSPVAAPEDQANYWTNKAQQAAVGAAVGGAVPAAFTGAARVLSPNASTNPEVQKLLQAGIRLTPGQALGGMSSRLEDKARSFFGLGDAITAAQKRGEVDLNQAVINGGLELVGPMAQMPSKAVAPGYAGLVQLRETAQKAYDNLVPHLSADLNDTQFYSNIQLLRNYVSQLPPEFQQHFNAAVNMELGSRLDPNGFLRGTMLQDAIAGIRREKHNFQNSAAGGFNKNLGDAFDALEGELRELLERTNPQYSDAFRKINTAWRVLKTADTAAKSVAAPDGIFTPSQLHSAVKAQDFSKDKRAFAEGGAFLQNLSSPAKDVMSSHYNDSGTAGRLAVSAGALASGLASPAIPLSLLGSAALYTPWLQKQAVNALTKRPDSAVPLAEMLRRGGVYAAPGVAGHVADR